VSGAVGFQEGRRGENACRESYAGLDSRRSHLTGDRGDAAGVGKWKHEKGGTEDLIYHFGRKKSEGGGLGSTLKKSAEGILFIHKGVEGEHKGAWEGKGGVSR